MDDLLNVACAKTPEVTIVFLKEDAFNIHSRHDDPNVNAVKCKEWEIKRVLVDQKSFAYILYWNIFERLCLDPQDLKLFNESSVGFS